jgi:transposase
MTSTQRFEIRSVIKFCQQLGKSPSETFNMLNETPYKGTVSQTTVYEWHKRFKDGRTSLECDTGRGRKRKLRTNLTSSIVDVLEKDRRVTVRGLAEMFGVGYGTVHRILTEELKMSKVCLLLLLLPLYFIDKTRFYCNKTFLNLYIFINLVEITLIDYAIQPILMVSFITNN